MNKYFYLLNILFFAGLTNVAIWARYHHILRQYSRLILVYVVLTLPLAVLDGLALRWGAWSYNPDRTLGLTILGAPLETYFFMILVGAAVSCGTIILALKERGNRKQL